MILLSYTVHLQTGGVMVLIKKYLTIEIIDRVSRPTIVRARGSKLIYSRIQPAANTFFLLVYIKMYGFSNSTSSALDQAYVYLSILFRTGLYYDSIWGARLFLIMPGDHRLV